MHTGVDIGDSVIIIADADPNHRVLPVRRLAYVPNVDEVCGRAWTVSREVVEKPKRDDRANDCRWAARHTSDNMWSMATR
jgi:hypothetical protein